MPPPDGLATALSLDPRQPDALLERGLLRQTAGDGDGAFADWTTVVNAAPDSAAARDRVSPGASFPKAGTWARTESASNH